MEENYIWVIYSKIAQKAIKPQKNKASCNKKQANKEKYLRQLPQELYLIIKGRSLSVCSKRKKDIADLAG